MAKDKTQSVEAKISALIKSSHFVLIYQDGNTTVRLIGNKTNTAEELGLLKLGQTMLEFEVCRTIAATEKGVAEIEEKAQEVMYDIADLTKTLDALKKTATSEG